MAAAAERLEQMLELVGATAVEDKLQVGYQGWEGRRVLA
jgi:hypothetical protein